ncbi:tetratricopeptide repeat protein [Ligilactobacillus ceti]|nr:tetratricopeptide repeat protein [Ligilactobacillus ceti]
MKKRTIAQEKAAVMVNKLIQAIDNDPYNVQNYYNLSVALVEMKSYPQAEELLKKALTIFKKQSEKDLLHYGLGNVYYSSELYEQAILEYQLIQADKLKYDAYLMVAQSYYAKGEYQQALVFALTATEYEGDNTISAKLLMANIFLAMGDFQQAKNYYDQVLKIETDNLEANFQRGVVALILEEDEAEYFAKVKELDSEYFAQMQQKLVEIEQFVQHFGPDKL